VKESLTSSPQSSDRVTSILSIPGGRYDGAESSAGRCAADELIVIDHLTGEQTIDNTDEVASWLRFFGLLRDAASTGADAHRMIHAAITSLGEG
jgi:hypothetical protein